MIVIILHYTESTLNQRIAECETVEHIGKYSARPLKEYSAGLNSMKRRLKW